MKYCACGCGAEVKRIWVRGHHNRVNPISKRPDIREKRRQYLKDAHAAGLRPEIWNKGLTAEDPRVANNVASAMETRSKNTEWKKNAGDGLRHNRITQHGENHWNWKGGASDIICMLRGNRRLYTVWKRKILERDHFECQRCRQQGTLQVHHDKETMADIIQKFVPTNRKALTFEQKEFIRNQVIEYHIDNEVSGISLCKPCHKLEHQRLKLLKEAA